ncbi:MAG: hypothetical protein ABIN48_03865 [Ginsengibacter sp.]
MMKTIFVLLTMLIVGTAYGQDRKTTQEYIEKIFKETTDYEEKHDDGAEYSITPISFPCPYQGYQGISLRIFWSNGEKVEVSYARNAKKAGYCTYGYIYRNINWAKMVSINDDMYTSKNSPIKFLIINFTPNSVLREGFISKGCPTNEFSECGKIVSVSSISFPYRNEPGTRDRLVKALNHLSKLVKEEAKEKDPFAD